MTQHTDLIERLRDGYDGVSGVFENDVITNMASTMANAANALEAQAREIAGLQAARMAYAREFPFDAEGEPDVGSIHQNIRAMKAEIAELKAQLAATAKNAFEAMPHDIPRRMKREICVNAAWSGSMVSRMYTELRKAFTGDPYKANEDLDAALLEIERLRKDTERPSVDYVFGKPPKYSLSYTDERDFCLAASPLIGAAYVIGNDAAERINKSPWGRKTFGTVTATIHDAAMPQKGQP